MPNQERILRGQVTSVNRRSAQANGAIGGLQGDAAGGIQRGATNEFNARTNVLDNLKALDDSFQNAATAISVSSTTLSTNVTAVAEQLANVNIPSEITFNGTINEGRPIVVSLAGQDALSTLISKEVATRVDELIRERINERTIANAFS